MFLNLAHTKLDVYRSTRRFVMDCYRLTADLPEEEKYNLSMQIRRAALSVHLNLAEGASRKSISERKRYFEISRGSVVEVDAALDIADDLYSLNHELLITLEQSMKSTFRGLSGLIRTI
ncbi:MAG: four helix bundle protein [Chitinophagales bacterium]|nr:four helix bundle protein [Chitinophagales bacterium]HAE14291.1 four helix bundle protein [Bacteroidota bacterium]MCB9018782.1 four helix bundle protein [Chitinophagales bacterium]MCB9020925.1 four helix bundle protein [Chitinophagales bacterium]MCB9031868.1 four helix bundle protein [Chitinophagales bacterium]